jgi:hypothetical protein
MQGALFEEVQQVFGVQEKMLCAFLLGQKLRE